MVAETLRKRRDILKGKFIVAGLTVTQTDVLRYILSCWLSGFLPSVREICDEFGWSSPNAAATHLRELRRKGYVAECDNNKAALMLTDESLGLVIG